MSEKKLISTEEFLDKVKQLIFEEYLTIQDDFTIKEFDFMEEDFMNDLYENRIRIIRASKEDLRKRNLIFEFKFQKNGKNQIIREKYGRRAKNEILKRLKPEQTLEDAYKKIAADFNSSKSSVEQVFAGTRPFRMEYLDYLYEKWGIPPYEIVGVPHQDADVNSTLKDLNEMMAPDADESLELNELLSKLRTKIKNDPSMHSRIRKLNQLIDLLDSLQ